MRTKKGIVSSAKMTDTVSVTVHMSVFHPIYKKRFRRSKKFLADCKGIEDLTEGDTVIISECAPMSKLKRFKVSEVVERVPRVSDVKDEEGIEEAIHGEQKVDEDEEKSNIGIHLRPESGQNVEPDSVIPDSELKDFESNSEKSEQ